MKTNVLVIEDNPGDANLIKLYLKESSIKHEFFHVETLYEGVELVEQQPVEIVLLDLKLPDSSGFRTLMTFRERCPKVPIIVLTGLDDDDLGHQAIKAGAQDYLVKGKQLNGHIIGRSIRYSIQRHKAQIRMVELVQELSMYRKRFLEAQEMARLGNWEIDIVTNEMSWSDEVYRIFGFLPQSISPTLSDYLEYIHIDDRERVNETFEQAIKDANEHKIEYRIIVDGSRIKHLVNQFRVSTNDYSQKILLVGAVQDITEQKQAEELIIEKNISDKASKIKEAMLEDLSFNIRTPLSSVVTFTHLLQNPDSTENENLSNLKTSVDDLSIAVNNLLNFSILLSEKITIEAIPFDLRDLLQRLDQLLRIKADKKEIELRFEVDEKIPEKLIGDEKKIQQILFNLIENGIKYSEDGGLVELSVKCFDLEANQCKLSFKVKDNGIGMPPEKVRELRKAEELLTLNEQENEQRSLGLAIVSRLTHVMAGNLEISSKVGVGSSFTIELPMQIAAALPKGSVGDKPSEPLNILLVEDHFLNQIATRKILTNWSDFVTVEIADNGQVGVEKHELQTFNIILMDLQMPVMNGFDATQQIRKSSDVPIIALSANTNKQEAEKCFDIGMNDYLAKPFKPDELFSKIMQLI